MTAAQIAQRIAQNVADVDADRITWDEFSKRNRAAWDDVAQGELNIIGSACDKRHMAVKRELARMAGSLHASGVMQILRPWFAPEQAGKV